jgi:hypothetical protein
VFTLAGIDGTAPTWDDVPEGAITKWKQCTFKGMVISKDRAPTELRWDFLLDTLIDIAYLLCNKKVDKLTLRDGLDRCVGSSGFVGSSLLACLCFCRPMPPELT